MTDTIQKIADEMRALAGHYHRNACIVRELSAFADRIEQSLSAGASGGGDLRAWVGDMKTSAGMDYYVCVGRDTGNPLDRTYLTPHKYSIRGRAEYDVAEWNHLLGHGPKPDILAFDTDATPPAHGDGEVWIDRTDLADIKSGKRYKAVVFAEAFDGDCIALTARPAPEADARDELAKLQFGWDERAADARRYQWLKNHLPPGTFGDFDVFNSATWDAAIDAAMSLPAQGREGDRG